MYSRPYDAALPVVCMDESSIQLIGELHIPIPPAPGHSALIDDEYVRNGEPEWTGQNFIRGMLEDRYPDAGKVVLVMDNLNTPTVASLYQAFPPEIARNLAERLEVHYTPKHGSWLNIPEIEISVLKHQCLAGRIPDIETMRRAVAQWNDDRNNRQTVVD